VLASQVVQMFYVPKSKEKNWHVVIVTKPRDLFGMKGKSMPEVDFLEVDNSTMIYRGDIHDVRDDIPIVTIDEPFASIVGGDTDVEV